MKQIFLLLFLCNSSYILSQNFTDEFYKRVNISDELALTYCDSILNSPTVKEKAIAYGAKAFILSRKANYNEANKLFENAYSQLDAIKSIRKMQKEKVYILNFHALHLLTIHHIQEANAKINEGIELADQLHMAEMQIKLKALLGRGFSLSGLSKHAVTIGSETITRLESLKGSLKEEFYKENLLYAYLNTSSRALNVFLEDSINDRTYIDTSQYYLDKGKQVPVLNNFKPNLGQELHILNLNADILFFKKEYQEASLILKNVANIAKANGLKKKQYQAKFRLAECYFFLNQLKKAEEIFNTIRNEDLTQYKLMKNDVFLQSYYAQIYTKKGDIEKALKYTDTFNSKLNNFYKLKSNEKIHTFTQNELSEKKRTIDDLKNELENSKTKNDNFFDYIICILAITIGIIIYYTHVIRKQKKNLNLKIEQLLQQLEVKKDKRKLPTFNVNEQKAERILSKLKEIEKKALFKAQDYSLNGVAKQIGSNSTYVSQVINKYWGKTFIEYTNELRIDAVILKLKEDKIYRKFTLMAIAESVGYKSPHSFNKHFKKNTGISPKQYIEYLQKKAEH